MQSRIKDIEKKENAKMNSIGIGLFCVYVLMSYLGNDVILPSAFYSTALYLFLGYSALFILSNMKIKLNIQLFWMLGFMALSLLTMLYSGEKEIFGGTFYLYLISVVLVLLLSQYKLNRTSVEIILWTYALSSFILVLLLAATGNLKDNSASGRLGTELMGNANTLATMLMVAAIYSMWLLVYGKNTVVTRIILVLCLLSQYFAMFLSGGRKFVIVPILFLYVLLVLKQDKAGRRHTITYTVIILLIAVILWNLIMKVDVFYNIIGQRMESLLAMFKGDTANADGSALLREKMIKIGIEGWLQSPIWGYGFDSFKFYNQIVTGYKMYSHNNFVEMLYNYGVIGFCLYYWFYLKLLLTALKNECPKPLYARAFAIATVISLLVFEYGAVDYTIHVIAILLFMAFALLNLNEKDCEPSNEPFEQTKENELV